MTIINTSNSSTKITKSKIIEIIITTTSTTKTATSTTNNVIPVCIGGYNLLSSGVTICNQDSSGAVRKANEVKFLIKRAGKTTKTRYCSLLNIT